MGNCLDHSDALISGGGSLFQDVTSARSAAYYAGVIWMARRRRKPVMFYAQGIGPLTRPLTRAVVRWAANSAAKLTVRDTESAEALKGLGVTQAVEVTADPAFALEPGSAERGRDLVSGLEGRYVGLAFRPWKGDRMGPAEVARIAELVEARTGRRCLLVPFHRVQDTPFAEEAAAALGDRFPIVRRALTVGDALDVMAACDCMVGMRLHSLMLGALCGRPIVAVSYDPKVDSFMSGMNLQGRCLPLAEACPERVADLTYRALEEDQATVAESAQRMRERALRTAEIAMELTR